MVLKTKYSTLSNCFYSMLRQCASARQIRPGSKIEIRIHWYSNFSVCVTATVVEHTVAFKSC